MDNTLSQGYTLLSFLYTGVCLGIVYGILRIVRIAFGKRWVLHMADGLFALALFFACAAAFKLTTGGALRLYGFLLIAAGFVLQQWAFDGVICKMIVKRRDALRKKD